MRSLYLTFYTSIAFGRHPIVCRRITHFVVLNKSTSIYLADNSPIVSSYQSTLQPVCWLYPIRDEIKDVRWWNMGELVKCVSCAGCILLLNAPCPVHSNADRPRVGLTHNAILRWWPPTEGRPNHTTKNVVVGVSGAQSGSSAVGNALYSQHTPHQSPCSTARPVRPDPRQTRIEVPFLSSTPTPA